MSIWNLKINAETNNGNQRAQNCSYVWGFLSQKSEGQMLNGIRWEKFIKMTYGILFLVEGDYNYNILL